jgi:hypothetical protein
MAQTVLKGAFHRLNTYKNSYWGHPPRGVRTAAEYICAEKGSRIMFFGNNNNNGCCCIIIIIILLVLCCCCNDGC